MYRFFIKPLLFLMQPERAHYFAFWWMRALLSWSFIRNLAAKYYVVDHPVLKRQVFGLTFKNPIGLAAGFDKDAQNIDELAALGFGFIEIGTITPEGQPGNPKPRLFRLPADDALINRMGFNNKGAEAAVERLKKRKSHILVGGNIGKNKITPNEEATNDYIKCFNALYDYVDYFVVNVSSPNTPNLRALQEKGPLKKLLMSLKGQNNLKPITKPILLKIAPDLTDEQLDDIIEIVESTKIDGVIATNTTISRDGLVTDREKVKKIGHGGLSGKPVKDLSNHVIKYLKSNSRTKFPVIGVGGIHTADDAIEKIEAGADLLQVYTGFVYNGPTFVKDLNEALISRAMVHQDDFFKLN
ncbi:MAG TPA: dihydroorotate dehydrogenase (quinone) [Cytophagales bacterium]|nr:dihydroorotate dehydrogenase (quinone) [Cytophagales bacterium]